MSRLIPILRLIKLLDSKIVNKLKLMQTDYERLIQLQLSDLVSTTEINSFLRLIIE